MKRYIEILIVVVVVNCGMGRLLAEDQGTPHRQLAVKTSLQNLNCEVDPFTMSILICSAADNGSWKTEVPCGFNLSSCDGNLAESGGFPKGEHTLVDALPTQDMPGIQGVESVTTVKLATMVKEGETLEEKLKKIETLCLGTWFPQLDSEVLFAPLKAWISEAQAEYVSLGCIDAPESPTCLETAYAKYVESEFSGNTGMGGGDD